MYDTHHVPCQVLTGMARNIYFLWAMTPCNVAAGYQTTPRHIREDRAHTHIRTHIYTRIFSPSHPYMEL